MALGELKNGIGPDAYAIYQQVLAAVVERDHPVGSLYISENATSPAELYGGTWERIEGRFIMGASDTYPAGSTGGSATHTQTGAELAPHEHLIGSNTTGDMNIPAWSWISEMTQISSGKIFIKLIPCVPGMVNLWTSSTPTTLCTSGGVSPERRPYENHRQ